MNSFTIIITAGGIGKRMGNTIPKQFLELNGLPILMHTIERFYRFDPTIEILVTLPADWKNYWEELTEKHHFSIKHRVIDGGIERYDSIKNALKNCTTDIVGVHDGVRPLVSSKTIANCLNSTLQFGSGVPVLNLKESVRKLTESGSIALERKDYVLVQTPQLFKKAILEKAYEQDFHEAITDDASLVEQAGFEIHICEGNEENIKITTPSDLKIAPLLLN